VYFTTGSPEIGANPQKQQVRTAPVKGISLVEGLAVLNVVTTKVTIDVTAATSTKIVLTLKSKRGSLILEFPGRNCQRHHANRRKTIRESDTRCERSRLTTGTWTAKTSGAR